MKTNAGNCNCVKQKLHALAWIANYIELVTRRSLIKAFITSKFKYHSLLWMFHTKALNNRINEMSKFEDSLPEHEFYLSLKL